MKKISVIFGAVSTFIFLVHIVVACIYYMGLLPYGYIHMTIGGILAITMSIHMIFSLILMVTNRQKDKKANLYPRLNMSIAIQSATGIFTAIFLILHVLVIQLNNTMNGTIFNIIYVSVEFIFILLVCTHIAISVPKHFISVGLVTKRESYPVVKRVTHIFVTIIIVMYVVSQTIYWIA